MDRVLIVLREGLGLNFEAMRPALQVGAPIAIGRGGAVIAEVLENVMENTTANEVTRLRQSEIVGSYTITHMALDLASIGEALGICAEDQEGGAGEFIELIHELKRDAERYRWLKQRAWYVDRAAEVYEIDHVRVAGFKEAVPVDDDDVQAAIDVAMSEEAADRGEAHE